MAGLKTLVDEFSTYARMPSASPAPVDAGEIVRSVAALYGVHPGIVWEVAVDPALGIVRADKDQLRAEFAMSTRHRRDGRRGNDRNRGRALRRVGTAPPRLADRGPGIAPGDRDKLFTPYFSTKPRGTGLGLAIVQRIVVEHRGSIRIEDNPGGGARFIVEIPAERSADGRATRVPRHRGRRGRWPVSEFSSWTTSRACSMLEAILKDEGMRWTRWARAKTACGGGGFGHDALLLDVWLPGVDGIETLSQLRQRGIDAEVVMISGHGTIDTAVKATKAGAFDFVEKPLSLEKTILVLRNALRQRRLEQRNRSLLGQLSGTPRSWAMGPRPTHPARGGCGGDVDAPVLICGEADRRRPLPVTCTRPVAGANRVWST